MQARTWQAQQVGAYSSLSKVDAGSVVATNERKRRKRVEDRRGGGVERVRTLQVGQATGYADSGVSSRKIERREPSERLGVVRVQLEHALVRGLRDAVVVQLEVTRGDAEADRERPGGVRTERVDERLEC